MKRAAREHKHYFRDLPRKGRKRGLRRSDLKKAPWDGAKFCRCGMVKVPCFGPETVEIFSLFPVRSLEDRVKDQL